MSETPSASTQKPARRRWFRRICLAALLLVVLVVAFHRPLLRFAITKLAQRAARAENIDLTWIMNGTMTKDLQIRGMSASGPAWLTAGNIGEISVDYNLLKLLREGPGNFLGTIKLHDTTIALDLRKLPPRAESPAPAASNSSAPPSVIWPGSLDFQNISADVIAADGSHWFVKNLRLQAGQGQPGKFSCEELRQEPMGWHYQNLSADVDLLDHKLVIRGFQFPEGIVLTAFQVELAKLVNGELAAAVTLQQRNGGAEANVQANVTALNTDNPHVDAKVDFKIADAKFLPGVPPQLQAHDLQGKLVAHGNILHPNSLTASVAISSGEFFWEKAKLDGLKLHASLENGVATAGLDVHRGPNVLNVSGEGNLGKDPVWPTLVASTSWQAELQGDLPDLAAIMPSDVKSYVQFKSSASGHGSEFQPIQSTVTLTNTDLGNCHIPKVEIATRTTRESVSLERLEIPLQNGNQITLQGVWPLSDTQPFEISWKAVVPELASALKAMQIATPLPLHGGFQCDGKASGAKTGLSAERWHELTAAVRLSGRELACEEAVISSVELAASMQSQKFHVQRLEIQAPKDSLVQLEGNATLDAALRFPVQATALVNLPDLAAMQPWLKLAKVEAPVTSGAVNLTLAAEGTLQDRALQGKADLQGHALAVRGLPDPLELWVQVLGSGETLTISKATAQSGVYEAELEGSATQKLVSISRLQLRDTKLHQTLLEGQCKLPFAALGEAPTTESMSVKLSTSNLSLEPFTEGKLRGLTNLQLSAEGNRHNPRLDVELQLKEARWPAQPKEWANTAASLGLHLAERKLQLSTEIHQAPFQPIKLTAETLVDVNKLLANPESAWDLPLQAQLDMAESNLASLTTMVPTVSALQATATLHATATGTLREPKWQGSLNLLAPNIAFRSPALPGVRDAKILLDISDRKLSPNISATLAGGAVSLTGTVNGEDLTNPMLDLHLKAAEALVTRDRNTSLRADADVTITGPLQACKLAGRVEAVRGRIFKEVEFLPLSLPDDLPPPPASVKKSEPFQLPSVLAQTSFDLALRTKDPLRLMGNVLNGAVKADLYLAGTGAAPILTGKATFDDALLSLPFSKLKIVTGTAVIDPAKPMEPQLNIRGEARVGEYDVTLYVFGSAYDPKTRFLSVPPLSEPDIAVLLATGAPLAANAGQAGAEAASQAAFILVRDAYRKMFHKTGPRYEEPPKLHLSFDSSSGPLGRYGPAVLADYDLTKRVRLSGSAAKSGNIRTLLSWLIRFGEPAPPRPTP